MAQSNVKQQLLHSIELIKAQRGEAYDGNVPELVAARQRCMRACDALNDSRDSSRRNQVELWKSLTVNEQPLPPRPASEADDEALLAREPCVVAPVRAEYGLNFLLGEGTDLNWNCTFHDGAPVTIGARSVVGPNCPVASTADRIISTLSCATATWGRLPRSPLPSGKIAGSEGTSSSLLGGVTVGRGCTVGAGSVVTRDIPPFHVVAGSPARIIRKITTAMDETNKGLG